MSYFNIRVYGLLINDHNQILVSDEQEYGIQFTKFPGGGLEYGEGMTDGLKREFIEECNAGVEILSHYYTTDFFVKSAFNDSQIISIYYLVKNTDPLQLNFKTKVFDFDGDVEPLQSFRWMNLDEMTEDDFTFPIDRYVAGLLIKNL